MFKRAVRNFGRLFSRRREREAKASATQTSILIAQEIERLRQELAAVQPKNPAVFGFGAYSQCDEDGIIQHILQKIAARTALTRTCIEIGIGNGTENNTHYLLLQGFKGVWIDGNARDIRRIAEQLGGTDFPALLIKNAFVTLETLPSLLSDAAAFLGTQDCDVLSLDVDGNDLYFAQTCVKHLRPRLFVCEYNAQFRPPMRMTIPYDPSHRWGQDDYFGASLMSFVDALPDYRLVCCNITGANAFFVRNDLADAFPSTPPDLLFQPLRLALVADRTLRHKPTLRFLKAALRRKAGKTLP
jgi:hypothetical protein